MIPAVSRKFQFFPFLISLLITLAIGFVASVVTRPEITGWYSTLKKPVFNPPPQVFPLVWSVIYLMIATSAYLVWKHRSRKPAYIIARYVYIVQLALNFSWSIVFFGLHQILLALIVIGLLWISILFNINWFSKYNKVAGYLLWPYLLWVTFAGVLNAAIYLLNK